MSEGIISATLGHNSMEEYLPQVQVLFLFSLDHDSPAYFRIMPGSINSVASLVTSIRESGVKRIVLVADTGFYPSSNVSDLDSMGISYIIPLKRNSKIIDYSTDGEKHFIRRDVKVSRSVLKEARERMGTISVITNLRVSGEIVYDMLKFKTKIDQAYVNYRIYALLKSHDMLGKYSLMDLLEHL